MAAPPPDDIPDLRPTDPRPGAGWYNALLSWVRRNRVAVAKGQGELELIGTPAGKVLKFGRYDCIRVAVTSGTVSARSGSTPGSGQITFRAFRPTTLVATGTATAYWLGSASIASGTYCYVGLVDGYWFILSQDCP